MKQPDDIIITKEEAYNRLKGVDTSSQPDRSSVQQRKVKKEFPKTESMLPNNSMDWFGLGKYKQPLFPLVKDPNGDIVMSGVRYSRKRQHGNEED